MVEIHEQRTDGADGRCGRTCRRAGACLAVNIKISSSIMDTTRDLKKLPDLLDLRAEPAIYGWPAIFRTAASNRTQLLRRFLKRSVFSNEIGVDGRTVLHAVALSGDYSEVAAILLSAGADPNIATRNGHTPLAYAERMNRPQLAATLRGFMRSQQQSPLGRAAPVTTIAPRAAAAGPVANSSAGIVFPPRCCIHSCHGRGRCVDGLCVCPPTPGGARRRALFDCSSLPATTTRLPNGHSCPKGRPHGVWIGGLGLRVTRGARSSANGRRRDLARDCDGAPVRTLHPGIHVSRRRLERCTCERSESAILA